MGKLGDFFRRTIVERDLLEATRGVKGGKDRKGHLSWEDFGKLIVKKRNANPEKPGGNLRDLISKKREKSKRSSMERTVHWRSTFFDRKKKEKTVFRRKKGLYPLAEKRGPSPFR